MVATRAYKLLLAICLFITCLKGDVLDKQGNASEELLYILKVTNAKHDGSQESIVEVVQREWLRKPGTERWHIQEKYADIRDEVMPILEKFGFVKEVKPELKSYRYAIVLGALLSRVRSRLQHLVRLWNEGVRFEEIVFLTGQRKLEHSEKEQVKVETETEMSKIVWEQTVMPEEMRKVKVTFVDTKTPEGQVRPNTGDTVKAWAELGIEPGSCLSVSNQPYIKYQDSVLKTYLPDGFHVETVGDQVNEDASVSLYLDTVARFLYQELVRIKTKRKL